MAELLYYDLKQVAGLAPSLSTEVARDLGRRIVSRIYAPGDLLEPDLAESSMAKLLDDASRRLGDRLRKSDAELGRRLPGGDAEQRRPAAGSPGNGKE